MRVPRSTYRLQVNADFPLSRVRELIDYFAALGISDLYLSPILEARPGSKHGYDVTDPGRVNHEVGGDHELERLARELRRHGMRILLDIVPNHMSASEDNPWWRDVLEHGPSSPYARFFDIDWLADPPGANRVLLPILGRELSECIAQQEVRLVLDEEMPTIGYMDRRFPIDPATYPLIFADLENVPEELRAIERSAAALPARDDVMHAADRFAHAEGIRIAFAEARSRLDNAFLAHAARNTSRVLEAQAYTLHYWLTGADLINYRRFFDITDLAGLRTDRPDVFDALHKRVLPWLFNGTLGGVRIDHIDGLRDPEAYLAELQQRSVENTGEYTYVVVEKILIGEEPLPASWQTAGTTGYDFLGTLNGLFLRLDGWDKLGEAYERWTEPIDFRELVYHKQKQVIDQLFAGDTRTLTRRLASLTQLGFQECQAALIEVTANLPVYRTYGTERGLPQHDERLLREAFARARARGGPALALDALESLLVAPNGDDQYELALRWQQFTGPVTAKGLEDTSFYNYHRLISACEVGGDPADPVVDVERFHQRMLDRCLHWPHALNATSTHDTKRGEDTRARLNVLTEFPDVWIASVDQWIERAVPDRLDALQIYQTLIGSWPLSDEIDDRYRARIRQFAEKAMREGKRHSSWKSPDPGYEKTVFEFCNRLLSDAQFVTELTAIETRTSWFGMLNGLSQLAIKLAAPGVPDIYQGSELWNLSLVDPDNRGPVDYELRRRFSGAVSLDALKHDWRSGRIKFELTRRGLQLRNELPDLFASGVYTPIQLLGARGRNAIAFERATDRESVILIAGRFFSDICDVGEWPAPEAWADTRVDCELGEAVNVFTGKQVAGSSVGNLLQGMPCALLRRGR